MTTERIDVTYKVVTPLFCGGIGRTTAELRIPSFKGVLRWWWRALAWSTFSGDLARIQACEDELFGSARGGEGRGQSKVIMRLRPSPLPAVLAPPAVLRLPSGGNTVGDGARYLGYGVVEAGSSKKNTQAGQLTRGCLPAPFNVELELRCRDLVEPTRALLLAALQAVGLLGGLGAKSRKGYGSLVLQAITIDGKPCWTPPTSANALARCITDLVPATAPPAGLPEYTALSSRTRVVLVPASGPQQPLELLDRIGRELMRYRSWGKDGLVLGRPREGNFRDDHDLMKQTSGRRTHPRRVVFGLPHNYGPKPADQVGPTGDSGRRASPLLIHIHVCGAMPIAVLSFLPATFLPGGDRATVDVGGARVAITPDPALWQPVTRLLQRFLDPSLRKEPFGTAVEVRL